MDILVSRTLYMSCQAGPGIEPGPSALKASALPIELTWQMTSRRHLTKSTMAFFFINEKHLESLASWYMFFLNFLARRSHFVRLPGAINCDPPVLSGVPQGTVLGPLLIILTKTYQNQISSVLLTIHGFIPKLMMQLTVTLCSKI